MYLFMFFVFSPWGCRTAHSRGLLLSVTQRRASAGIFHWSGSVFIKRCATGREEYLAARLVGTCCCHRSPWRNSLFWVDGTLCVYAVNMRVVCDSRDRKAASDIRTYLYEDMRIHTQTHTHTHTHTHSGTNRSLRLNRIKAPKPQSVQCTLLLLPSSQTTTSTTTDISRWTEVTPAA